MHSAERQDHACRKTLGRRLQDPALAALFQRASWRCDQAQARLAMLARQLAAAQKKSSFQRNLLAGEQSRCLASATSMDPVLMRQRLSWFCTGQQQLLDLYKAVSALQSLHDEMKKHCLDQLAQRELMWGLMQRRMALRRTELLRFEEKQADTDWLLRCTVAGGAGTVEAPSDLLLTRQPHEVSA